MSMSFSFTSVAFSDSPIATPVHVFSHGHGHGHGHSHGIIVRNFLGAPDKFRGGLTLNGGGTSLCRRFRGLKLWILEKMKFQQLGDKWQLKKESKRLKRQDRNQLKYNFETGLSNDKGPVSGSSSTFDAPNDTITSMESSSLLQTSSATSPVDISRAPSLCIAIIGATGELAKRKIFPALFALYYSGFLPKNVGIFGYSRKNITDKDLRSIIASTLTCRVDHQENCGDKMDDFLSRTYYVNGGYDNKSGMSKLNDRMEQIELDAYLRRDPKPTGYSTFLYRKKHFWMLHHVLPAVLRLKRAGIA